MVALRRAATIVKPHRLRGSWPLQRVASAHIGCDVSAAKTRLYIAARACLVTHEIGFTLAPQRAHCTAHPSGSLARLTQRLAPIRPRNVHTRTALPSGFAHLDEVRLLEYPTRTWPLRTSLPRGNRRRTARKPSEGLRSLAIQPTSRRS